MMKLLTFVIIVLEIISCMFSSWWMYKSLHIDNESKLNSFQDSNSIEQLITYLKRHSLMKRKWDTDKVGIKPDDD